jgi:hypothetical protein
MRLAWIVAVESCANANADSVVDLLASLQEIASVANFFGG